MGHKVGLDIIPNCYLDLRDIVFFIIAAHFLLAIYVDLSNDKSQFLLNLSLRIRLLACLSIHKNVDELLLVKRYAVLFWDRHNTLNFDVLFCREAKNF